MKRASFILGLLCATLWIQIISAFSPQCKPLWKREAMKRSASIAPDFTEKPAIKLDGAFDRSKILKFLPRKPMFTVFKKACNLYGLLFGVQCWSIMILWLVGMLAFMPFKIVFAQRLDKDGIIIDALGRWWSRLVTTFLYLLQLKMIKKICIHTGYVSPLHPSRYWEGKPPEEGRGLHLHRQPRELDGHPDPRRIPSALEICLQGAGRYC